MSYSGIVIHHSACESINGKGYDYFVAKEGLIIPAQEKTDPNFLHVCVEGDFSKTRAAGHDPVVEEQFFLLEKLIMRLCLIYKLQPDKIVAHHAGCPSANFPWSKLVILPDDMYH